MTEDRPLDPPTTDDVRRRSVRPTARILGCLLLVALLVGCSDDDDSTSTTTPTSPTTTSSTSSTSTSSATTAPEPIRRPSLEQSCTSPDGFTIDFPTDWESVSDCGQFGPAPLDEPASGTDERPGVVTAYVDAVAFADVTGPGPGETARAVTTVDGLQAVRVESVSTGEGLYPAGTASVTWMVDLAVGTDDGAGTLFVDGVDAVDPANFDETVTILDAMARSLDVDVGDEPRDDAVVARYEGGGAPLTVAAAPSASSPATCLRLVEADGIACVEAVDSPDGVALTGLDAPSGPITVGITGSEVFAVDLTTGGQALSFLPVPYPGRESRAFAVPVEVDQLESVTVRAIDGTNLREVSPADARRPATG